jgi:uncharacterized damage-inducible protein DinB
MTGEERHSILEQLAEAVPALENELDGVPEAQARQAPGEGRWSILDCLEHVALAEATMLHLIANESTPAEAVTPGREDKFLRHSTNRARTFTAPERARPKGSFASLNIALDALRERRAQTIRFIEQCDGDLRDRKTLHPVAGQITCRECLALLIGHPMRHIQQIREIKAQLGIVA